MDLDGIAQIKLELPILHQSQLAVARNLGRHNAVRCGRRWGATTLGIVLACGAAARGRNVLFSAPSHNHICDTYDRILDIISPIKLMARKVDGRIRTNTGGNIRFGVLSDHLTHGCEYDLIVVDDAARVSRNFTLETWRKYIAPSMLMKPDAQAILLSTPNGDDPSNFFWQAYNDAAFKQFHVTTMDNPIHAGITPNLDISPMVYRQEYMAEFVGRA